MMRSVGLGFVVDGVVGGYLLLLLLLLPSAMNKS